MIKFLNKDDSKTPSIYSAFQNTDTMFSPYWSSTTSSCNSLTAWSVSFSNGDDYYFNKSNNNVIRCVRGDN